LLGGFRQTVLKVRREGVGMKSIRQNIDALLSKRPNLFTRVTGISLLLLALCSFATHHESHGQQLRDVFRIVQPAVVMVRTQQIGLAPYPQQGLVSSNGLGSGVLISNDRVLTAAHLVESTDRTVVEFSQGELISATVIGCALSADVALLELDHSPANYSVAKLSDSDQVAVGDEVFVVGAPYGISNTLSAGHVSGRRVLNNGNSSANIEFLQTDAAINSRNSGSPVFNLKGEVVGIVSNIMSKSGGSEGLAFAASSNTVRRALLDRKPFWTGIEGVRVDGRLANALNLPQSAGILVQRVAEGSIAARAGIRQGTLRANVEGDEVILGGDIILSVNGIPVEEDCDLDTIYGRIAQLKPGENLVITILRKGKILKLVIPISR